MRRIETEAGVIVGRVDRALRRVLWHLECPDCQALIPFSDNSFHGKAPLVCECGWKTRPIGHKDRSEDGSIHAYYDYQALAFGDTEGVQTGADGIHAGMRF
jgi:hypothetical protein